MELRHDSSTVVPESPAPLLPTKSQNSPCDLWDMITLRLRSSGCPANLSVLVPVIAQREIMSPAIEDVLNILLQFAQVCIAVIGVYQTHRIHRLYRQPHIPPLNPAPQYCFPPTAVPAPPFSRKSSSPPPPALPTPPPSTHRHPHSHSPV